MNEKDLTEIVRAFIAIYEAIDGVSDEQSRRDWELTQEHWVTYTEAKKYLARAIPPGRESGQ